MSGKKTNATHSKTAILYTHVAIGAVLGGLARWLASLVIPSVSGFPLATLFVNVTGSFIIGFYGTISGPDGRWFASAEQRQFVMTGFCGGYTTFSSFSLETVRLLRAGLTQTALLNIGVSVVTWLLAVWLGHVVASRLNRLKGD
ncbi:MAG TPA: fluoride efflux transporter CrcB [Bradyrhizobium sp.]|uniref:fluoride efflux transporter CrcB n=1 Tax=Bradyrhizobium sp. TaxID=376 RepID=UPI002C0307A4|nr:fluoride efflux transporter CrcB [Bradyrhizobium sp.]HLZ03089.1 fluoride efflux transporter CrcB [Bradyrhizobium sp.]